MAGPTVSQAVHFSLDPYQRRRGATNGIGDDRQGFGHAQNDPASGAIDGRGRQRHLAHDPGPVAVHLAVESHQSLHLPEAPQIPGSSITGRGATENGNRNLLQRRLSFPKPKGTGRPVALA
jgi:hypothetical protein